MLAVSKERAALAVAIKALRRISKNVTSRGFWDDTSDAEIARDALVVVQSVYRGLEDSEMRPEETLEVARAVREKHPRMSSGAESLLLECESRAHDGRSITEGQAKWIKCARRAKGFDETGKPSNWRGSWVVGKTW